MHRIEPVPVRKSVAVRTSPQKAFEFFVNGMGGWWIKEHSLTESGQKTVIVEARAGGRWYEVGNAGEEREWGRVITCDPPHRILLAWQLNADFDFEPKFQTEVEVWFEAKGEGETIVTLEHRDLGNYGVKAEDLRGVLDSEKGWGGLLASFAAKVA
ncbi:MULTISPECIES: SRPBCC family protein [Sinorhizobium]|uniref:Activator of Hsp90 ATPase 1 family protein n=1 Tax=Rhizobium fredii TaxID=380 RepID=A0A2L0H6E4_RHIFR|nr:MULTISPECIES: SRPBCC family protein [Sinorhizobium]AUX76762.1 activator of Hsp90 ATPase 1 family protein [Sinorhizobium fredii]PDT54726.1 ATPase [Sinorhizobium sp. NG07B]POH31770.1 ATPase [Sinorhizobium americanum]